MPTQRLNWGLLSTARISRSLIPILQNSERNRLAAVASRSQDAAETYARQWEIPRAFASYDAMLQSPEIDVIYNPLPNHLHAEWTIKALQAGKHVLCEKPLALTLAEVDAMAAAAKRSGRVLAEAFMYRHHPLTLKVMEVVRSGVLGTLQLVKGAFTFNLKPLGDIRVKKETGGGSIWDVGCYPISYARMVCGAEPVEAFGWQIVGSGGVDEYFDGALRFPNDVRAEFDSGFRSPSRAYIEVVGSGGVLHVPHPFRPAHDEKLMLTTDEGEEVIEVPGEDLYRGEVEDMADAILLGKEPRISLADSRGNVRAILALLQSAATNQPVRV
jgi:D-xylose 1-dehydrogenase (NADP+, D-xylono-1,5-lactone-forming)